MLSSLTTKAYAVVNRSLIDAGAELESLVDTGKIRRRQEKACDLWRMNA